MARPARKPIDMRIRPTPERLAKGDVAEWSPKMAGGKVDPNPQNRVHRVTGKASALSELLGRGTIGPEEYEAGRKLGSAYERATREVGAVNLDSIGGGFNGGLTHSRCEAMDMLHGMLDALGTSDHDRRNRAHVLIAICAQHKSLREYAPGARARQAASNMLVIGLQRLHHHLTSGAS